MPKVERLESDANGASPIEMIEIETEGAIEPEQSTARDEISFELAKGKGKAVFRMPTVRDLLALEARGFSMYTADGLEKFCFELAEISFKAWGDRNQMPSPESIRRQDSEAKLRLFVDLLTLDGEKVDAYTKAIDEGSSRGDGLDAFEIRLTDGSIARFDEPSEADIRNKNSKRPTEGMVRFCSRLCTHWNGEPVKTVEMQVKIPKLSVEDFSRVATGLNTFHQ